MNGFDAAIFDMDGVITDTAAVHSRAWKQMFDEYLRRRELSSGEPYPEFTHAQDYRNHVDGKPRYDGVQSFLGSRGIQLPFGDPTDHPRAETVCGLGNRKNELFNAIIEAEGVTVYPAAVELIRTLRDAGIAIGLATSSRNASLILEKAGLRDCFDAVVDGLVSERMGHRGKPEPDIFVAACDELRSKPDRAVVIEDAVPGVQAGARGGFALVVGVAHGGDAQQLLDKGADVVVRDLGELTLAELDRKVRVRSTNA